MGMDLASTLIGCSIGLMIFTAGILGAAALTASANSQPADEDDPETVRLD